MKEWQAADGKPEGRRSLCVFMTKMSKAAVEEMSVAGDLSKPRTLNTKILSVCEPRLAVPMLQEDKGSAYWRLGSRMVSETIC